MHHVSSLDGGGRRGPFHGHVIPEDGLHSGLLSPPALPGHPADEGSVSVDDCIVLDEARVRVYIVPWDVDDLESELGQRLAVL